MSIAKLRQTAALDGRWTRWAWGCWLASACVTLSGCDQRNLAVIALNGIPSGATAITAYYRLDGSTWKSLAPQRSLSQFGIELPKGRRATLETQVFGYSNNLLCSLGNAAGVTDLDGGSIRELTMDVTTTTGRCTAAIEPADFPQGKMVVWANAASDIWVAGSGGKVVHWDGVVWANVPLPAQFAQSPPDWNAILGDGGDIWLAGTNSAVARYTAGELVAVPLIPPVLGPTDWRSMAMADEASGEIVLAGSNRMIGVAGQPFPGVGQLAFKCGTVTPPGDLTAVGCPSGNTAGRCFFLTDQGGIASLQSNAGGMPPCKNIASPTTKGLLDVFVGVNVTTLAYDVHIVGRAGAAFRSTTPLGSTTDPNFMAANTDYSSFIPASARVDLNRIYASPNGELWVAGQGGVLMRWQNTPAGMPPVMPFSLSPTGTTANLHGLSAFGSNLFFSGANHTLGYVGSLFTPN